MDLKQIRETVSSYSFLRESAHLGDNIILLNIAGSYAYGTNIDSSDIDLRGCALNRKVDILTNNKFDQFVDNRTDTTIYSFNKIVELLGNCNPNVVEMLGCKPEHYLYVSKIGQELLNNVNMFLSRRAVNSFGGYVNQQLRRLDNKSARDLDQKQLEIHILNSIMNAFSTFPEKYFYFDDDRIKLYIDKSDSEDLESEIFMDVNLHHYPLRDYKSMWSEMNNIVKDYATLGKRNKHAIMHDKLGKHMMHLIRLYATGLDILEHGKVVTYREQEHDMLMDIRNGKFLDDKNQPTAEFFDIVNEYENRFEYAKENTSLPNNPNYKEINEFQCSVNERIIKGEINNECQNL